MKGLVHQGLGRRVWNAMDDNERDKIVSIRKEKNYQKYNILHFKQVLANQYGIKRSHETLRKLLLQEGLALTDAASSEETASEAI